MCGWPSANCIDQESLCNSTCSDITYVGDHGIELWPRGLLACKKMQKSLLAGALGPPQDARCGNIIISKHPERLHDVDRFFFHWCWSEVALYLPDECGHPSSSSGSERDPVLGPRSPVPGDSSLDHAHIVSGPRRTMPHMSRKEWYEMYLHREPQPAGGTKASQRTFERMYRGWKKHLRIAQRIQLGKMHYLRKF